MDFPCHGYTGWRGRELLRLSGDELAEAGASTAGLPAAEPPSDDESRSRSLPLTTNIHV